MKIEREREFYDYRIDNIEISCFINDSHTHTHTPALCTDTSGDFSYVYRRKGENDGFKVLGISMRASDTT